MTENERLKKIRKTLGLSQRVFSEAIGIKQGSYSDVERGKSGVSALIIKGLMTKYRIDPLWLCEGKGSMFIKENVSTNKSNRGKGVESSISSVEGATLINKLENQQLAIEGLKGLVELVCD